MKQKPSDLLDFLRQSAGDEAAPEAPPQPPPTEKAEKAKKAEKAERAEQTAPQGQPTPRMILLRRSQVIVAAAAAGLALVLFFFLGLALGGGSDAPAAPLDQGIWGVRIASYPDTEFGRSQAQATRKRLLAQDLDEVSLHRIRSQGLIVVLVGSFLERPHGIRRAEELLANVKKLQTRGKPAFPEAFFWSLRR